MFFIDDLELDQQFCKDTIKKHLMLIRQYS